MNFYCKIVQAQTNHKIMLEIIQRFNPLIQKYSALLEMEREDAISELTIELMRVVRRFPAKKEFMSDMYVLSYIKKSIRNFYISLSKELAKRKIVYMEDETDTIPIVMQQSTLWVDELILNLTKLQRKIILLRYYYGYSDVEIANFLHISRQAVNQTKNRALEKLRKII